MARVLDNYYQYLKLLPFIKAGRRANFTEDIIS